MTDLISRQAALEAVGDVHPLDYNGQAILNRLEELPTIEPKPSHDWNGWENGCGRTYDVQPKKGKWIEENRRPKSSAFYCSVCHRTAYDPQNHRADVPKRCRYAYCPNCGAQMERREDERTD